MFIERLFEVLPKSHPTGYTCLNMLSLADMFVYLINDIMDNACIVPDYGSDDPELFLLNHVIDNNYWSMISNPNLTELVDPLVTQEVDEDTINISSNNNNDDDDSSERDEINLVPS